VPRVPQRAFLSSPIARDADGRAHHLAQRREPGRSLRTQRRVRPPLRRMPHRDSRRQRGVGRSLHLKRRVRPRAAPPAAQCQLPAVPGKSVAPRSAEFAFGATAVKGQSPLAPGRPVILLKAQGVAPAAPPAAQGQPPAASTQGYGKQYLKVPTDGAERANRRVTVRRITPLPW
jgi:hypothetical protein